MSQLSHTGSEFLRYSPDPSVAQLETAREPMQWTIVPDEKLVDGFAVVNTSGSIDERLVDYKNSIVASSQHVWQLSTTQNKSKVDVFDTDVFKLFSRSRSAWDQSTTTGQYYSRRLTAPERVSWRETVANHLLQVRPPGCIKFQKLRFVRFDSLTLILSYHVRDVLDVLPNLQDVTVDSEDTIQDDSPLLLASTPQPIPNTLQKLTAWAGCKGSARRFADVWGRFQEKGVKLYLTDSETKQKILEISVGG